MPHRQMERRTGLSGEQSEIEQRLQGLLFSWTEPSSVDLASGNISQFNDKVAAGTGIKAITASHALAQATGAKRCAAPTHSFGTQRQLGARFVRASAVWYDSNSPASSWRFLHDGTGFELWLVHTALSGGVPQVPLGTRGTSGTGLSLVRLPGLQTSFYVLNVSTFVIQSDANAGGWVDSVPTYVNLSYATSDTPDWSSYRKTTQLATGNEASAPAAGDSSATLRLGSDGSNNTEMAFASLMIYKGAPSASVRTLVQRYLALKFAL